MRLKFYRRLALNAESLVPNPFLACPAEAKCTLVSTTDLKALLESRITALYSEFKHIRRLAKTSGIKKINKKINKLSRKVKKAIQQAKAKVASIPENNYICE